MQARFAKAYIATSTIGRAETVLKSKRLNRDQLEYIIFDEADEMMEQGLDAIVHMLSYCKYASPVFASATFNDKQLDNIKKIVDKVNQERKGMPPMRTSKVKIEQRSRSTFQADFRLRDYESKIDVMKGICTRIADEGGKRVIFCETRKICNDLHKKFCTDPEMGDSEAVLHHGQHLTVQLRAENLARFQNQSPPYNLIASNILSRGTDIEAIRTVINLELPGNEKMVDIENYTHRMGRATRSETAGGKCINIVGGSAWTVDSIGVCWLRSLSSNKNSRQWN